MRPPRALPQAKLGATHVSIIKCHSTSRLSLGLSVTILHAIDRESQVSNHDAAKKDSDAAYPLVV